MARKRKDQDLVTILVTSPWWLSASIGCIAYAAMRWLVPAIFASKSVLTPLSTMAHSLAWMSLLFFGGLAVLAFLRSFANQHEAQAKKEVASTPDGSQSTVSEYRGLGVEWGYSGVNGGSEKNVGSPFNRWTMEGLRVLEWKRFELLCAKYYEATGFICRTQQSGADGGIDVRLFKGDLARPIAIVQCKAWATTAVGVKEVRELLGVMAHERVARGIFITTGTYTRDAREFGRANPIQLLDGAAFLEKILGLPVVQQDALMRFAFDGDYRTPTCASCGIKLVRRNGRRGQFWGCINYPRCRTTLPFSA